MKVKIKLPGAHAMKLPQLSLPLGKYKIVSLNEHDQYVFLGQRKRFEGKFMYVLADKNYFGLHRFFFNARGKGSSFSLFYPTVQPLEIFFDGKK